MKEFISAIVAAVFLRIIAAPAAVNGTSSVGGDVNNDGVFNIADVVSLQKWLIGSSETLINWEAGDLYPDECLDSFDLVIMKNMLLKQNRNIIRVTDTEELKSALSNAKPGDEIVLAPGEYIYSGATPKGRMFTGEADGRKDAPIVIRSEDPDSPSIISGISTSGSYALTITGDWWVVENIKITNAAKGVILDNSNHTRLIGCEVYNIGQEGVHFRDGSSYCTAENCFVHDTGLQTPAYGEGFYVGSAKSTTEYDHSCHYNRISGCTVGPNVAAEHVDVKEYTIGTIIEKCIFDGTGMSGENYADSFVDLKGNDCILRYCTAYRNGSVNINRAFEMNRQADGWGQNAYIYGNKAYMDTSVNSLGKKMVMVNSWDCTETVWGNFMAYEDGILFSVDNEEDRWKYYNCSDLTYGDPSMEAELPE